jgi:hypothetical protein
MKTQLVAAEIIAKARRQPTLSIPESGFLISESGETASYDAARKNRLGVPVIESGGKLRCRSVDVLNLLGLSLTEEPLPQTPVVGPVNAAGPLPAERPRFRKARKSSTRTDPASPLEPAPSPERLSKEPHEQMQAIQQRLMQLASDVEQLQRTHSAAPQPSRSR